ncbi:hypothetical protein TcCL_NonESM12338 [Trypanosoma cruzi]|nr:hypothetical protein TcCL_NonESM12338 [Trypanosoma cruzi]
MSGRSCLFSVRGTAPPTQRVACDPQGACRSAEEWAGGRPSAACWSARSGSIQVRKRLRRRQSTDAVPTAPQHSRLQRAGTWCRHASEHHRLGIERAPDFFAQTASGTMKTRRRA